MTSQEQNKQPLQRPFQTKKYIRGTFLYATDDNQAYEQKNKNRIQDEIIISDKANIFTLKQQLSERKQQLTNKRKDKSKKDKATLIPIRDTPVQPLPEPSVDYNNKCERATQQQFEYFQTYISQKQKQRKFFEQQQKKIDIFQKMQQKYKKNEQNIQRKSINIIFEKQNQTLGTGKALKTAPIVQKKKSAIKIVIKKKQVDNPLDILQKVKQTDEKEQNIEVISKVRVIEE